MKRFAMVMAATLAAATALAAPAANDRKAADNDRKAADNDPVKVEKRAQRMIKSAQALLESGEDERAVNMLEAVPRMYPESKARFTARLVLGRHYLAKRTFDKAGGELRAAATSDDPEICAESLLLQGQLHLARGEAGEAVMVLRRLTQDYPTSDFANDAFLTIGKIHFDAGRWARAAEAYSMVGTAVPMEDLTNRVVQVEAGQRVFVHVRDKDLGVLAAQGDKTYVEFGSPSGDREKAELVPFGRGDGDFLASVPTASEKTEPQDGVLTVYGKEKVAVSYLDVNTESGAANVRRGAGAGVVSTANIQFMDGAERQRVRGVFADQPAFIKLRDFDLDATPDADTVKVALKVQYRERPEPAPGEENLPPPPPAPDAPWLTRKEYTVTLTETGPRTGVFSGKIIPTLKTNDTARIVVTPEDKIVVEYTDEKHLLGNEPLVKSADAQVLVGGSTEPQSIVAHSSEATIQAKKLLLEAQLLQKWGAIFKDVGLESTATAKADEGLDRVADLMDLAKRFSLDRNVVEEAYAVKWDLYLVKGNLSAAIGTCRELVSKYPDTVLADRAFMQIGLARREEKTRESMEAARTVFQSILSLPKSPLKAEASFRIAETLEDSARMFVQERHKPDFSAAMLAYKNCAETYPTSSFAGESLKKMVDYCISTKNYGRAQEILERVFEDYPDAPWLDEMLLKWGVVANRMGNKELAKEKFNRILEEYPGGKAAATASGFLKKLDAED